jgi:DNA-binding NtrC family response regulator
LVESEVFGHENGAFTGAEKRKYSFIELAHQGVLFLDEIVEPPLDLQVKLIRVLQVRVIRRVGREKELTVNIRVIAATNKDLTAEIQGGRLREDLYYRLAVVRLDLPSLRFRSEDVDILAEHLIEKYRPGSGFRMSTKLIKLLKSYSLPGNVREMKNLIQWMLLSAEGLGRMLVQADMNGLIEPAAKTVSVSQNDQYDLVLIEKHAILKALERFGTQSEACKRLGISESQLRKRMKDFGIDRKRTRTTKVKSEGKDSKSIWQLRLESLAAKLAEFTTQQVIATMGGVSRKTAIGHLNTLTSVDTIMRVRIGNIP